MLSCRVLRGVQLSAYNKMFVKGNGYNEVCIRPRLRATSVYDTWMLMELDETWFIDFDKHDVPHKHLLNAYSTS